MLLDGNLMVNFSTLCTKNNIDSVQSLKNQLDNDEFMASDEGQRLTELLERIILTGSGVAPYTL